MNWDLAVCVARDKASLGDWRSRFQPGGIGLSVSDVTPGKVVYLRSDNEGSGSCTSLSVPNCS